MIHNERASDLVVFKIVLYGEVFRMSCLTISTSSKWLAGTKFTIAIESNRGISQVSSLNLSEVDMKHDRNFRQRIHTTASQEHLARCWTTSSLWGSSYLVESPSGQVLSIRAVFCFTAPGVIASHDVQSWPCCLTSTSASQRG
jgi:hypothetical protein